MIDMRDFQRRGYLHCSTGFVCLVVTKLITGSANLHSRRECHNNVLSVYLQDLEHRLTQLSNHIKWCNSVYALVLPACFLNLSSELSKVFRRTCSSTDAFAYHSGHVQEVVL